MSYDSAKRVISGTWGEVWLDNEYVAEVYKFQAKISYNKTEIARCGQMGNDQKVTGYKGTGSIGMRKINSRMGNLTDGTCGSPSFPSCRTPTPTAPNASASGTSPLTT